MDSAGGRNQVRAFLRAIHWVARDAFGPFRRDIAVSIALHLLGIGTGSAALGGLLAIVRSLDSGGTLRIHHIVIPATTAGLIALTVLFTAVGLVSAACLYSGARRIARVAIAYEKRCRQRLLRIAADPRYRGWQALVTGRPTSALASLSYRGTQICSVVLRRTLGQILSMAMLAIGSVALIVVDPLLTLLLTPLAIPYLVLLVRVGSDATRHQQEYAAKARFAKSRMSRVIDSIVSQSASAEWKLRVGSAVFEEPEQHEAAMLFYQRRLAPTRMQFFNSGLFAISLATVISFFALTGESTGLPWFTLLFYLVVLRFTIGALHHVTSAIAVLSRHYPEAVRMAAFVEGANALRTRRESSAESAAVRPDLVEISTSGAPRWNGAASIVLRPGAPLFAIAAPRPSHGELERVGAQLSAACGASVDLLRDAAVLATPIAPMPRSDRVETPAADLLGDLGVADEIERIEKRRREGPSDVPEPPLGPEAAFGLGAVPLALPHDVTILAARPLLKLDSGFVARLMAREANRLVVLVDDRPGTCFRSAFQKVRDQFAGVAVLVGGRVVACGDLDWLRATTTDIDEALAPAEREERDDSLADLDLDDDEEEEL